ncbi:hypothetical protein D3C78_986580 [compost metagenome]
MLEQYFLYLTGVYFEAACDNHILDAIYDGKIALFVHHPQISRSEPAITKCEVGFERPIPIAEHNLRAAYS